MPWFGSPHHRNCLSIPVIYTYYKLSVHFVVTDTLNIKPLSKDLEWSQEALSGAEATGVREACGQGPAVPTVSTSSEERAIRRVMGRWGAEWLS